MDYIIFKDGKKKLNLKIDEDSDKEQVVNSVKYCMRYLGLSNGYVTLKKLKKILKYDTTVCAEPILEKSIVIDLDNIDTNAEVINVDEELVQRFNEIVSEKMYKNYLEMGMMLLTWIIVYFSDYVPNQNIQKVILLATIAIDIAILFRLKDDVRSIIEDFKAIKFKMKKKENY